jgi:mannosyltransferase OCH1-like enzyme
MIPRILHRIWFDETTLSDPYGPSWKSLHPNWEHRLWNLRNLPEMRNRELFDAAPSYATKTDILRYELMHLHGGVYADFDVEPLKPFDPLLNRRGFLGRMKPSFEQIVGVLPAGVYESF